MLATNAHITSWDLVVDDGGERLEESVLVDRNPCLSCRICPAAVYTLDGRCLSIRFAESPGKVARKLLLTASIKVVGDGEKSEP